jgi:hypothetical protein
VLEELPRSCFLRREHEPTAVSGRVVVQRGSARQVLFSWPPLKDDSGPHFAPLAQGDRTVSHVDVRAQGAEHLGIFAPNSTALISYRSPACDATPLRPTSPKSLDLGQVQV